MLEMLVGPQNLQPTAHEIADCFQRIDGLVDYFGKPDQATARITLEGGDMDQREIRWRIERVKRHVDLLRAKYSRNAMVLPWLGRKRNTNAAAAIEQLGSPPKHGFVVDQPEPITF